MSLHLAQFAGVALVDVTLKAALAVGVAGLLAAALRRAAASTRHAVWLTAIVVLIALPLAACALPQISLPLLPAKPIAAAAGLGALPPDASAQPRSPIPAPAGSEVSSDHAFIAAAPPTSAATRSWSAAVLAVWVAGMLLMTLRAAVGLVRLHHLRRHGEELNDSAWRQIIDRVRGETGVQCPVRLLRSPDARIPMSWGLWRIYVCLPPQADQWCAAERRMVLTHELTHGRRGDFVWQLLDQRGRPVAQARLAIVSGDRYHGSGRSDHDGRFTMGDVPESVDPKTSRYKVWRPNGKPAVTGEVEVIRTDPLVLRVNLRGD